MFHKNWKKNEYSNEKTNISTIDTKFGGIKATNNTIKITLRKKFGERKIIINKKGDH